MASTTQVEQIITAIDASSAAETSTNLNLTLSTEHSERRSSRGTINSVFSLKQKPLATSALLATNKPSTIDVLDVSNFDESENVVELQPVDKGFGAWSYVTAAFAMYIVVWGLPQAFPIFQTYLTVGPGARFPDSTVIRLLAPGLQDIEEGLIFPVLPSNPKYRRTLVIVGIFIVILSTLLASFCEKDYQIVLTQGVAFGVGGVLLNFVHVSVFSEWFDKKKGQAMGIIWMGWRVGALTFPLVCQWLLQTHGYEQTLRVLIAPILSLTIPSILLLRGRHRAAKVVVQPTQPKISKLQAFKSPSVMYCLFASFPFFMVVNVPKMFITGFAADLGMTSTEQAFSLVFLVLSDMMGTYVCGHFSNASNHEIITAVLAFATAFTNLIGLGFAKERAGVYLYAVSVGLASGGFSNCLYGLFGAAAGDNSELFTAIHGIFSLFRGAAILSVGPIGAKLIQSHPTIDASIFAISKYRTLAIYAAVLSAASGVSIITRFLTQQVRKSKQKQVSDETSQNTS